MTDLAVGIDRRELNGPARPAPTAAADEVARRLFEAEAAALETAPLRRPSATYRLQLHQGFRLDDVNAIVGYLHDLGISDCYLSPYLEARPGSTHGYDVFDHARMNPQIGDEAAHARLLDRLRHQGMGRVLDVVPNHMGIGGPNRYWLEVLENGPQSPSARFFDIDWNPVKEELEGRVLLPILEDQYGKVLEEGKLVLEREGGELFIRYHDHRLPVAPRSYVSVLERPGEELFKHFDPDDEDVQEYRSIWASALTLAEPDVTSPVLIQQRLLEKEVLKRRIRRLCSLRPDLCAFLDRNVASFRGTVGDPSSFDALDRLLQEQVYRLAYWRVAAEEINYRRFFDINELAGLRTEDPIVFETIHQLIFRWVDEGGVTGLRIDHPDGLADPLGYFRRLQETLWLRACRQRFEREEAPVTWHEIEPRLRALWRAALEEDLSSPLARRFPIVAEKILSKGEDLPDDWPIDGTVGYGYLNVLNGLFVDGASQEALDTIYVEFTGDTTPFPDVLYESKQLVARASMASEVNMLARQLNRVSESDRKSRDFTLNELRRALGSVIASFPVYRTYLQPGQPIPARDRGYIEQAVARARRRSPTIDASVFAFLQDALLSQLPEPVSSRGWAARDAFVIRFQQTTGPMQAKGLEDTAFYRQVRLASLNEVGGDPTRLGISPSTFHAVNALRLERWPGSMATTATHDTKRGEDTRIRINVISELADEWRLRLARWSRWNARKKVEVQGRLAPDPVEEYLLYQTLLGAWPTFDGDETPPEAFVQRVQNYMVKAAREAKRNTTWTDPDPSYAEAILRFVGEVLTSPDSGPFLKDFLSFQRRVARIGVVHSLAQTLLKLVSPGVPDVYQGCELWDFSLVDPDNRRPVDYERRRELLGQLRRELADGTDRATLAGRLFGAPEDGAIKLYLIWTVLNHRRSDPALYGQGQYRPIEVEGRHKAHVVALGRYREGRSVLAVAPRLVAGLMGDEGQTPPLGDEVWEDTHLVLPEAVGPLQWNDLLTDRRHDVRTVDGKPTLALGSVLAELPVALLISSF